MEKIVSIRMVPPNTVPRLTPTTVANGSAAFRRAWPSAIRRSVNPLARAVRT
jgi:hypothetical protein